jgi:hypothetical protein
MKKITLLFLLLNTFLGYAQNTVTIDGTKTWNGYVGAFNTADDSYAFGFTYDIGKIKSTVAAKTITLQPNFAIWTDEDGSATWFDSPTAPNKYIVASSYVEDNALAGSDLTFEATIDANTISDEYLVVAFIKALDPTNDYATVVDVNITLTSAMSSFSISATAAQLQAGYVIQYGFSVKGAIADPTTEVALGSVIAGASDNGNNSDELNVSIDGSNAWKGFVTAYNVSDSNYAFNFAYDVEKNKTTITSNKIILQPNFIIWTSEKSNVAWFDNGTTPNKFIEASSYVENNALAGSDLTFSAEIDSYTIDAGYTVVAFIKALDPNNDYATIVNRNRTLTSTMSSFSISATGDELQSGYVIQYGFSVTGPLGDPNNEASIGSVVASATGSNTAGVIDNNLVNFSMFPNPSQNKLNISARSTIKNVAIYNILGKKVINLRINKSNQSIDVSALVPGVYLVKYEVNNFIRTAKFVKQ